MIVLSVSGLPVLVLILVLLAASCSKPGCHVSDLSMHAVPHASCMAGIRCVHFPSVQVACDSDPAACMLVVSLQAMAVKK